MDGGDGGVDLVGELVGLGQVEAPHLAGKVNEVVIKKIMAGISEFIVSVVELVDAQADDIRCSFLRSANSVLLNTITSVICIIGLVFFLLGLHTLLEKTIEKI